MATPYEVYSFDANSIGPTTDYYGGILGAETLTPITGTVEMQARRSIEPQVMNVSRDGRTIPLVLYPKPGGATSLATFRSNVKKWFTPGKNTSARYLVLYAEDAATLIRVPCYVQSVTTSRRQIDITLTMAQPWFEANTATTSAANPASVTNAGNVAVRPSIALTQSTHKTLRACTVAGVGNTGNGLTAYPIWFDLDDAVATSANTYVFVNGVSVPCFVVRSGTSTSGVWALVDTKADSSTTPVDIIYGTSLVNPLCQTLADPGFFSEALSTNTLWNYTTFPVRTNARHPGAWFPGNVGKGGADFLLTSDGATVVFDATATPSLADYDCMILLVPTGITFSATAQVNMERVSTGHAGANSFAFVRYRTSNTDTWTDAWTVSAAGTVNSALTMTTATMVAVGLDSLAATFEAAKLTVMIDSPGTYIRGTINLVPTVNVAAAANFDYYDGTLVVGGYTLTFDDCLVPDGTLTIDCQTKAISSSVAGALYNLPKFSDPSIWAALLPGVNTITDGLVATASDTWSFRDGHE